MEKSRKILIIGIPENFLGLERQPMDIHNDTMHIHEYHEHSYGTSQSHT